jgi:regulatory protein
VARAIVLRLLTGAARSRGQLEEALRRRDVPDEVAERVLDRFTEVGLIDDAAFARSLVVSRQADRGLSRRALAAELRRRGVGDEDAAQALALVDDDAEVEAARRLAERALRSSAGQPRQARIRRAVAALGRRGYPPGLSLRLVGEALSEGSLVDDDAEDREDGEARDDGEDREVRGAEDTPPGRRIT